MKIHSIRTKLILVLLPLFILAVLLIALLSYHNSAEKFYGLGQKRLELNAAMAHLLCYEQEQYVLQGKISRKLAQERIRRVLNGPLVNGLRDLSKALVSTGEGDYFFAIDSRGLVALHPHLAPGTDVSSQGFIRKFIEKRNGIVHYKWKNTGETAERDKLTSLRYFEPWDWIIGIGAYKENFLGPAKKQLEQTLLLVTVFSGILIIILLFFGVLLTRPLIQLTERVAQFDFEYPEEVHTISARGEVGALVATFNRMVEGLKERKYIKETFGRYVSNQVREAILSKQIPLEGELKKATVLFTDIRGFTGLSEMLGPQKTVQFLNEYFSRMVEVIIMGEGSIDKFIGDSIMAVFGAPLSAENDAERAVRAGIDLIKALDNYNITQRSLGENQIKMGIGIHTGLVIAGNIGSPQRMEYTVVGDTVNLASRVQSLTAQYKIPILITDSTVREIQNSDIRTREIDSVRVKGRRRPVVIFEVYDCNSPESIELKDRNKSAFLQALMLYKTRQFEKAMYDFEQIYRVDTHDHIAAMYTERCRNYLSYPPVENWDGVFENEGIQALP